MTKITREDYEKALESKDRAQDVIDGYKTQYLQPPGLRDVELPNCCLICANFERFNPGDMSDGICKVHKCHVAFDSICDSYE